MYLTWEFRENYSESIYTSSVTLVQKKLYEGWGSWWEQCGAVTKYVVNETLPRLLYFRPTTDIILVSNYCDYKEYF